MGPFLLYPQSWLSVMRGTLWSSRLREDCPSLSCVVLWMKGRVCPDHLTCSVLPHSPHQPRSTSHRNHRKWRWMARCPGAWPPTPPVGSSPALGCGSTALWSGSGQPLWWPSDLTQCSILYPHGQDREPTPDTPELIWHIPLPMTTDHQQGKTPL